jgi:ArsR family transcriptional regulator, zinc-responsive transcriptional repressor
VKRSADYYDVKARTVAALANPVRLALLDELAKGPHSAGELVRALAVPQPLVSQHLAVLRSAGVVVRERQGTLRIYRLSDPKIAFACALMGEIVLGLLDRERTAAARVASVGAEA